MFQRYLHLTDITKASTSFLCKSNQYYGKRTLDYGTLLFVQLKPIPSVFSNIFSSSIIDPSQDATSNLNNGQRKSNSLDLSIANKYEKNLEGSKSSSVFCFASILNVFRYRCPTKIFINYTLIYCCVFSDISLLINYFNSMGILIVHRRGAAIRNSCTYLLNFFYNFWKIHPLMLG